MTQRTFGYLVISSFILLLVVLAFGYPFNFLTIIGFSLIGIAVVWNHFDVIRSQKPKPTEPQPTTEEKIEQLLKQNK